MGAYLQVLEGMCDCGTSFLVAFCMVVAIYAESFNNGPGTSAILLFWAILVTISQNSGLHGLHCFHLHIEMQVIF
jgi:hypothetical protein